MSAVSINQGKAPGQPSSSGLPHQSTAKIYVEGDATVMAIRTDVPVITIPAGAMLQAMIGADPWLLMPAARSW